MSITYAVGDIHGRIDVLNAVILRIEEDRLSRGDETGENTTIVFLGDYIDRGPHSRQVVERLMEGARDKAKWVTLLGNHELMALMAHANPEHHWKFWTENGGITTSLNYDSRQMPIEQLQWINNLPDRYQDAHRLFVHAGVKKDTPLHHQTQQQMIWVRHPRNEEVPLPLDGLSGPLYVVHGHTPFMDGPVVLETRCNLDTQSYRTGMQCIAVFDDAIAGKPIKMLTASAGFTKSW